MNQKHDGKVIFITGAGRGMGTDIARAALDAGYLQIQILNRGK